MSHTAQHLSQGATLEADGVRFRLWAPGCDSVALLLEVDGRTVPMRKQPGGFYDVFVDGVGAGTLYRYQLPDGLKVPDPASRYQPQDVHGPSEVIDPNAYDWTESWRGRPWNEIVLWCADNARYTRAASSESAVTSQPNRSVHSVRMKPAWCAEFPLGAADAGMIDPAVSRKPPDKALLGPRPRWENTRHHPDSRPCSPVEVNKDRD